MFRDLPNSLWTDPLLQLAEGKVSRVLVCLWMVQGYVSIYFPADLMTTDGKLHVSQNPVAVLDPTTDQWCVELHCGTFTYFGQPPFDVQWIVSDNILSKKGMDKNTSVTLFCLMHSWQNFVRFLRSSLFRVSVRSLFSCSLADTEVAISTALI